MPSTSSTGDSGGADSTSGGNGGGDGAGGGNGGAGGGSSAFCTPGTTEPCYDGPDGTQGIGICTPGVKTCNQDGSAYGDCEGEVTPLAEEACDTPEDDDCDGQMNEADAGCVCEPGTTTPCYTGPADTMGVGACVGGIMECAADGKSYGSCMGEVVPQEETCLTPVDDDCNGQTNEGGAGCVCMPGEVSPCYSGPAVTKGVGLCHEGTHICNDQGTAFSACDNEVVPAAEVCNTPGDDDCDGQINEGCTSYAVDVQPILGVKCAPCHTTFGDGGAHLGNDYSSTQLPSTYCPVKTKGECSLIRVQNGSMPQNAGCTGDPALDSAKPKCLTAAEQATLQAWIADGQLP